MQDDSSVLLSLHVNTSTALHKPPLWPPIEIKEINKYMYIMAIFKKIHYLFDIRRGKRWHSYMYMCVVENKVTQKYSRLQIPFVIRGGGGGGGGGGGFYCPLM